MGCVCGKLLPDEDSRDNRSERAAKSLPAATAVQSGKPAAMVVPVSSLKREVVTGSKMASGTVGAVGKKAGTGANATYAQEAEWREREGYPNRRRIGGFPKAMEGEQIAAGWPAWLAMVAGEAIQGWVPRRADSFEKLDKIGQGTYSNVYRARDLDNEKIVALKKVRFDNMEPESVKFMAREILILRRLDHRNIIKLEGLVTSRMSCSLYLVFEYMEHDLAGLASFPGMKFTEPQIKCYMKQLLHGLDHCHSRGILHRDIKGSNLLIDNSGILKIADFGLASFFNPDHRVPLTSRVVTLWYRPPELLLGATNYGVAVDLWSTGCILAELYAGKPIMPGRTEVEQLHKIFKLCGSPSEGYWRKSKLPHATIFKPQQPYRRCVSEIFRDFPLSALALTEILLAVDPADRGTSASALKSEFFTAKPLPCDPSSLPKYPPSKELDVKRWNEESQRQGATGGKLLKLGLEKKGHRESRAVPAPDANAELISSMQKRQGQANSKSRSEKFNPHKEEAASGFRMEPPQVPTVLKATEDPQSCCSHRATHSGPLVHGNHQSPKAPNAEDVTSKNSARSNLPGLVARKNVLSDGVETFAAPVQRGVAAARLSESGNEGLEGRTYNHAYNHRENERNSNADNEIQQSYGPKGNKMHYSGPLLRPSGNVDQMLKEHDRQIQEVFRQARLDKSKARKVQGDGNQLIGNPSNFGAIPVYPSSRGSSVLRFTSDQIPRQ